MFAKPGSMLLTLGNLPPQVSRKDLKAHVQAALDELYNGRLRLTSAICSCTIVRLTNSETGAVSHQGILAIQPAKLALDAMELLEERPLRGVKLRVSRFRHGSFAVDTERPLMNMSDLLGVEQDAESGLASQLKLDLVADTGLVKPQTIERANRTRWGGLFAH